MENSYLAVIIVLVDGAFVSFVLAWLVCTITMSVRQPKHILPVPFIHIEAKAPNCVCVCLIDLYVWICMYW